jgi:hypothetical protein
LGCAAARATVTVSDAGPGRSSRRKGAPHHPSRIHIARFASSKWVCQCRSPMVAALPVRLSDSQPWRWPPAGPPRATSASSKVARMLPALRGRAQIESSDIDALAAPAVGITDGPKPAVRGPHRAGVAGLLTCGHAAAAPPLRSEDCNSPATADCNSSQANSSPSGLGLNFRDDHSPLETQKLCCVRRCLTR